MSAMAVDAAMTRHHLPSSSAATWRRRRCPGTSNRRVQPSHPQSFPDRRPCAPRSPRLTTTKPRAPSPRSPPQRSTRTQRCSVPSPASALTELHCRAPNNCASPLVWRSGLGGRQHWRRWRGGGLSNRSRRRSSTTHPTLRACKRRGSGMCPARVATGPRTWNRRARRSRNSSPSACWNPSSQTVGSMHGRASGCDAHQPRSEPGSSSPTDRASHRPISRAGTRLRRGGVTCADSPLRLRVSSETTHGACGRSSTRPSSRGYGIDMGLCCRARPSGRRRFTEWLTSSPVGCGTDTPSVSCWWCSTGSGMPSGLTSRSASRLNWSSRGRPSRSYRPTRRSRGRPSSPATCRPRSRTRSGRRASKSMSAGRGNGSGPTRALLSHPTRIVG